MKLGMALVAVVLLAAACGSTGHDFAAPLVTTRDAGPASTTTTSALERTDPPPRTTAPDGHVAGHWRLQWRSPDGATVLGFWSGECESPSAWFADGDGPWRPVVPTADGDAAESYAYGWTDDGRAMVYVTEGICGTGVDRPGTYLVTTAGIASFDGPSRWRPVERTLEDLQQLLRGTDMDGAMDDFLQLLRAGDEAELAEALTSAGTWNHMGSLFDNEPSFTERDDSTRWMALQLRLTDELEVLGVATPDVRSARALLQTWHAKGVF